MADFKIAYYITEEVEGGWSNDIEDKGGETWKGIARNIDKRWEGWKIIDNYKTDKYFPSVLYKDEKLQDFVLSYYKQNYWDSLSLDSLDDQKLANELYDTGVNMGVQTAAIFFQRVLNVLNRNATLYPDLYIDGKIGKKTLVCYSSLSSSEKDIVYRLFNSLQGARYIAICEANPSQEKFMRGWAKRVFEA